LVTDLNRVITGFAESVYFVTNCG